MLYACKAVALFNMERYSDAVFVGMQVTPALAASCVGLNLGPFFFNPHMIFAHLATWEQRQQAGPSVATIRHLLAPYLVEVARLHKVSPLNGSFIFKLAHGRVAEVLCSWVPFLPC